MAWGKWVEKLDTLLDGGLVVLGLSQVVRNRGTQTGGTASAPVRSRPPVAPKIPDLLADMEDSKREEVSGWLAKYAPEALEKLELLKTETLQKVFAATVEKREQMVKSLRLPLAGPQNVPQKARFIWAETKKKFQHIEGKIPKTAAAIHEAAEKRRRREQERETARQNPKTEIQRIREWLAVRRNRNGGN